MGHLITKGGDKLGPAGDKPEETLYVNIYHIVSCISIVIIDGSLILDPINLHFVYSTVVLILYDSLFLGATLRYLIHVILLKPLIPTASYLPAYVTIAP